MLFNSGAFLIFFPILYLLYWLLQGRLRWQNLLLLAASYIFYAFWDWRFLGLLLVASLIDYGAGLAIYQSESTTRRRAFLTLSMTANLGILGFFKYFNFFAENLAAVLNVLHVPVSMGTLNVLLPAGISFYTFQSMSYGIDIYRKHLVPTRNVLDYLLFVSFFPHLVAGPIMRATALLPQVLKPRTIVLEQVNAGVYLILWGYFKKVVLADNLKEVANEVFNHYHQHAGLDMVVGILAFTFQIYGDFSGYTDIARGIAKLLGFELILNFNLPYFAISPSDFWRRWHISLSTWLRDYLYVSLGGNRGSTWMTYRNLLLTMLLGGLWHGAGWHFVLWGAYHGCLLVLYRKFDRASPPSSRLERGVRMAVMFVLTCIGWVIFRAASAGQIAYMLSHVGLGNHSWFTVSSLYKLAALIGPLLLVEWFQYRSQDPLVVTRLPAPLLAAFQGTVMFLILVVGNRGSNEFIYFQF